MTPSKGYYSLVQYCPDSFRTEVANIGVLLFCPQLRFLDVRLAEGNNRVSRFFGRRNFDPQHLNDAKHALENRLRRDLDAFRTLEELTHFIETRGNSIILTLPRPTKVFDPATELDDLFNKLVGTRQAQSTHLRSQLGRHLKEVFNRPNLRDVILRNQAVRVPVAGTILKAPYAFQNGTLNLICPLSLTTRTLSQAKELAVEGDLLHKHRRDMEHPASLWVALAQPTDAQTTHERDIVAALFADYSIPVYREEKIEELANVVQIAAHEK